jgi:hypothetical protein
MEDFLTIAAVIAASFVAGYQFCAVTYRRRRREQRGL